MPPGLGVRIGSEGSSWLPRGRSGRECSPPLSAKHKQGRGPAGMGSTPSASSLLRMLPCLASHPGRVLVSPSHRCHR